jgi:hypothetical protein
MPGIVTTAEVGGGLGKLYLDESGGFIAIAISAQGATAISKFRVAPFVVSEGGAYAGSVGGQEINVSETAANLVALIAANYKAASTVQAVGVYQTKSDHTGVLPTALDVSAATHVGTFGGGSTGSVFQLFTLSAHGSDFSRWQAHFFGADNNVDDPAGRVSIASLGGGNAWASLGNYLMGLAAGPGIGGLGAGLNTQVVTHAGEPIVQPMYLVTSVSRRRRRRYRVL